MGRQISVNRALRACGLFDPDSEEILPAIESMIVNRTELGEHHFRVVTE